MTSIWFPNNKYPPNTKNYLPCFVLGGGGGGFSIRRKGLGPRFGRLSHFFPTIWLPQLRLYPIFRHTHISYDAFLPCLCLALFHLPKTPLDLDENDDNADKNINQIYLSCQIEHMLEIHSQSISMSKSWTLGKTPKIHHVGIIFSSTPLSNPSSAYSPSPPSRGSSRPPRDTSNSSQGARWASPCYATRAGSTWHGPMPAGNHWGTWEKNRKLIGKGIINAGFEKYVDLLGRSLRTCVMSWSMMSSLVVHSQECEG